MRILTGLLPKPPPNNTYLETLVRKLQVLLGIQVHTEADAEETEAINYFLR